ncbi:MAG: tripartite tricarboxylate transporter substrate binding protein [Betaproteobacteria bacterium]|nr:tripartite tricarboxylate transporter substrate binding protein [Betaproteobacteria bacterium]
MIARAMGEKLSVQMGQPVIVDNRPGAGGRVATELLAKAEPDGYTLLMGSVSAISVGPLVFRKLPYDVERDLLPLTRTAELIIVMVVHPSTGAKNVKEFIDFVKRQGDKVRFGSAGVATPTHLAGESLQRLAGIRMTHVPYKGGGPAVLDLVAGDLHMTFSTYVTALPHIKSGRLRALAVTTPQRQPLLPDLTAVAETVPGFNFSNWQGMFAPAKTPRRIADRLVVEINKAILAPDVKKRLNAMGIEPIGSQSRKEFAKFVREDRVRWAKVIGEAGIKE